MIQTISPYAYRLKLLESVKIHDVFHISLLDPAGDDPLPGQEIPPPPPVVVAGENEYHIEEILDSRIRRRKLQYLVKWTGYNEQNWEPAENLEQAEAVDIFDQRYPTKPGLQPTGNQRLAGARQ